MKRFMRLIAVLCICLIASPAWALNARNFPGNTTADHLDESGTHTFDLASPSFLALIKPANFTVLHVLACQIQPGFRGWALSITTGGQLHFNATGSGAEQGTIAMSTGQWYAVMFYKASGAGGVVFKVMPMATQNVSSETINTGSYTMTTTSADPLRIGNYFGAGSNDDAFAGVVQRAALVNTSVSDADFKIWANGGATPSGTVGAWSIQGDSPEQDLTANNIDLTVTGTTVVTGYVSRRPSLPILLQ